MTEDELDQLYSQIRDDIPESFWKAAFWDKYGFTLGSLDIADRKRISLRIIEETVRRLQDDKIQEVVHGDSGAVDSGSASGGSDVASVPRRSKLGGGPFAAVANTDARPGHPAGDQD